MNLDGSAIYLRQQLTQKLEKEAFLVNDSEWMKLYVLAMIAAELEALRGLLERSTQSRPERTE